MIRMVQIDGKAYDPSLSAFVVYMGVADAHEIHEAQIEFVPPHESSFPFRPAFTVSVKQTTEKLELEGM